MPSILGRRRLVSCSKIEQLDRYLDSIEQDVGELRQELAALNRRLDVQFRWLIGIQFGVVGLLISILLKG